MFEKKVLGILISTMEGFSLTELCVLTNTEKALVKETLDKLVKKKKVVLKKNKYFT